MAKASAGTAERVAWSEDRRENEWTIICGTDVAESPEEAFRRCGADPAVWFIAGVKVNEWNMTGRVRTTARRYSGGADHQHRQAGARCDSGNKAAPEADWTSEFGRFTNRQMTITLRRRMPQPTAEAIRIITERMAKHRVQWPKIKRPKLPKGERLLLESSIVDAHFGKLAWPPETGDRYDIKEAKDRYIHPVHETAAWAQGKPIARVAYIVGHDLLHSEGASQKTAHDTPQDCDGRWQKAYMAAFDSVCYGIEYMAAHVAPVDVVVVPGNHDKTTTFYLGHALQQRYRDCEDIAVDNSPRARKRLRWGTVLLGFCHGGYKDDPSERDLPLNMAQEWKRDWAETFWREWHLGDKHIHTRAHTPNKPRGYEQTDNTYTGVVVRRLPSLCGTDAWHYGKGYLGLQSSEAYLWSDIRGPAGSLTIPWFYKEQGAA